MTQHVIRSDIKNIVYCDDQLMDIYPPRGGFLTKAPVVMYIHGGGWTANDKSSEDDQLALIDGLRDRGFAIASINYGLVPKSYFPQPVNQTLCAIRYLRGHAHQYGLDSKRIAVYGFSAGGYLAAMAGLLPDGSVHMTSEYTNYSSRVQAVVTLAGLFDFTSAISPENKITISNFLHGADPAQASVTVSAQTDNPPFMLVHGMQDQYVSVAQDEWLRRALDQAGVPNTRLVVDHADHGLNPRDGYPKPTRQDVGKEIQDFIWRQLHVQVGGR
jgi:acetyl esterase/lipase